MAWPFLQHDSSPLLFAHRGGNLATENTIDAFRLAKAAGYTYIETDIQLSQDGVVVVFHDSTLNRLTGNPDYISDLTWAELKDVQLRGGGTIPRLDEVLQQFPNLKFNIDPKADRAVVPLAKIITQANAVDRVCVASFSGSRVKKIQRLLGPELCTAPGVAATFWLVLRAVFTTRSQLRYACIQVPNLFRPNRIGKWLVRRIQESGTQVHVWTPNSVDQITRALDVGVDGIITDEIELLQDLQSNHPRTTET